MPETPARNETISGHSEPILNTFGAGPATDPRCRLELFGGLRLLQGDRVLTRFRTHKAATLLAYLALHLRQSHPRDQLVDLFWPEMELEAGRVNLSTALTSLRRPLEPPGIPSGSVLVADRRSVQLNPAAVATDVAEFDALLDAASRAGDLAERTVLLERAVGLYRGELFPGCLEEWALLARARCSERYVDALEHLAAAREETGDLEGALAAARRAVEADPYREEPYRAQMRLYAFQGRVAAALETYRKLEQVLQAELGVSPAAVTRELAAQLQRNPEAAGAGFPARGAGPMPGGHSAPGQLATPPAAVPGSQLSAPPIADLGSRNADLKDRSSQSASPNPHSAMGGAAPQALLPLQLTRCFGREAEIAALIRRLGEPETRLATLTGPGGVGKTRLALEVARHLAPTFDGRVWFVELAALPDPNLIPFAVANALKLPLVSDKDPLEAVVEMLADTPCLLLLDNFEHLLREGPGPQGRESQPVNKSDRPTGGTALVRLLLERVPQLTCLVTSRQPLHLGGEQEFPVPTLGVPTGTETPERLMEWGSVALYADRAQLAKPDFALTERNAEAVARLCRKLEGMPLAIEMAAAWVKTLSPARILERLERQLELLVSRRRDLPPRHQSLRATIEWSHGLLTAEQQTCFARLSVFRGGWSLEAAEAVCGGEALTLLSELQEQSLLVMMEGEGEARYRLLEPLREYAAEKLEEQGGTGAARAQHAAYFLALAEEPGGNRSTLAWWEWLTRLELEYDNLRSVLEWSLAEEKLEEALRLAGALAALWGHRGPVTEGRRWLEQVLAKASAQTSARARALQAAGWLAVLQDDGAAARPLYEQSLAIWQALGDKSGIANSLHNLGDAMGSSDLEAARSYYERSLALWQELGNRRFSAAPLCNLGYIAKRQGDYLRARALFEEAMAIDREFGHRGGDAAVELGDVLCPLGEYARARAVLSKSLADAHELGNRVLLLAVLCNFARLAWAEATAEEHPAEGGTGQGRLRKSARLYGAAAALRDAIGLLPKGHKWERFDREAAALRAALGEEAFAAAWTEGHSMTLEQAINDALSRETPA
jgi:predicted ATPase/DNA-binding SARP family transcriptional activator